VVAGICPGARALAVAALLGEQPALVVVPTAADAEALVAGLEVLAPHIPTVMLPVELAQGSAARPVGLGATSAAVAALLRWARGEARIVVVPAPLLPHPLPPPSAIAARTARLAVGDTLHLEHLTEHLLATGYRRVEVVEEAGEFALRGHLLDLGCPEAFYRLVLDVDSIEEIRNFDPTTQRSVAASDAITVPPLTLFELDPATCHALATRLEATGFLATAAAVRDGRSQEFWAGLAGWVQDSIRPWELAAHCIVCELEQVRAELQRSLAASGPPRGGADGELLFPAPAEWLAPPADCLAALARADRVEELVVGEEAEPVRFATSPTPQLASRPQGLVEEVRRGVAEGLAQVLLAASRGEAQRLLHLLAELDPPPTERFPAPGAVGIVSGRLPHGFRFPAAGLVVFGRADLTALPPPARTRRSLARVLSAMRDLKAGDYVVHAHHGIGRFLGVRTLDLDGEQHEVVEIEFAGGAKLFVPLERADVLEKHSGGEGSPPPLDRLGGTSWARTKARVKKAIKEMAQELLQLQAQREVGEGFAFSKDSPWQREFEDAFEYDLTPDQETAVAEVKRAMESRRPMDHLLVGDVGYGKTEVAMRAAFKAVMDGKQVALLAPTTVLAEQHYRTFTRRFAGFPVEIRRLSRVLEREERRETLRRVREGTVDILIGTHRLLGRDVAFRDLGLVIVDEEQRFGVAQKERLKVWKTTVDVLALSATPIPRTLNLGLLGLREVSVIETPPRDRLAVETHVLPFRREVVREAILTELARGGQVYVVHNRVASIAAVAALLREIVPEARLAVAHGQMDAATLERAMDAFIEGRADVLLATSIVENGLDIPNANTLIVNRADRFGLAQLYQLRGRVGRSDRLAFAYLLVPPERSLSLAARQRLAAILEFAELGAGFRIAARDLEIRGAGNLLGAEQHGHLRAVGYETYCRLLEEAVRELRGEEAPPPSPSVELRLGLDLRLPESYIPEETLRLTVYRQIAGAAAEEELDRLLAEFADRFGPAPPQLANLALHQRLRRQAERAGILRVRRIRSGFELTVDPTHPQAHATVLALVAARPGSLVAPEGRVVLPVEGTPAEAAEALLRLLP
jgi:transcription-repair coupling factor (superfamily II helicase)